MSPRDPLSTRPAQARAAAAFLLLVATACTGAHVERVVDGESFEGRAIAPGAYASYVKADLLARAGNHGAAVAELRRALDADPASPEILTRLGELTCGGGRTAARDASGLFAFDDALKRDPRFAPAYLGRARCLAALGRAREALAAAERAARLDPLNLATTETMASLLFESGRGAEAWLWLEARIAFEPSSRDAWRLLLRSARAHRDEQREKRARHALDALDDPGARDLDQALESGDLDAMRHAGIARHLHGAALALYALPRAPKLALAEARATLRADPNDADAWVAGLCAADLLGDEQSYTELLPMLDDAPSPPSRGALSLLTALLARRVGSEAAGAFAPAPSGSTR